MKKLLLLCMLIFTLLTCELFIGIDGKRYDGFVNFDYVRDRIKDSYAQLAWKEKKNNFNWDEVTHTARKRITSDISANELFRILKETLHVFKDAHITFPFVSQFSEVPGGIPTKSNTYEEDRFQGEYSGFTGKAKERIFTHYLRDSIRGYSSNKVMMYGIVQKERTNTKNIGYVHINEFDFKNSSKELKAIQKWTQEIDSILKTFHSTDGLILDIRHNAGGYPSNMLEIAGRFAKNRRHFMNTYMKNGPGPHDFAKPYRWHVEPKGPKQYTKPIVLITDGHTASAAEYFTLALRKFDNVTHFGQRTQGVIGYAMITQMPNGWTLLYTAGYSVGITADNKEKWYEQDGIKPEDKNIVTKNQIIGTVGYKDGKIDPMLDEAIITLLKKL